jgi:hypothetical protein
MIFSLVGISNFEPGLDGFCLGFPALYEYVEPGFANSTGNLKIFLVIPKRRSRGGICCRGQRIGCRRTADSSLSLRDPSE